MDNYFVIIGDVIDSRKIQDRMAFQAKLNQVLNRLNLKYASAIAAGFAITLGDEFQGVLRSALQINLLLDELSLGVRPVRLRFGIGIGTLSTPLDPQKSYHSDGPAFWNAREAIQYIHDHDDYGTSHRYLCAEKAIDLDLINSGLAANDFILERMTVTQKDLYAELLDQNQSLEGFEQKSLVEPLGISASSVLRRIKYSGLKIYLRHAAELSKAIDRSGNSK